MSCSPYDLRDYLLEELTGAQGGEVRTHLKSCAPCSSELRALRLTHSALLTVRDEEMPQRIGFVSDKVFEPSAMRRWFAGCWTSAARLGFISAVLLSAAILVHAWRPAQHAWRPAQVVDSSAPVISQAEVDRRIGDAVAVASARVQKQIDDAVIRAVADTEQRAQQRANALLAASEKRSDRELRALRAEYLQSVDYMKTQNNMGLVAQNYSGGAQ